MVIADKRRRDYEDPRPGVARTTVTRPRLAHNEIAIALNVELPDTIFDDVLPEATITVPEGAAIVPAVEVTLADDDAGAEW